MAEPLENYETRWEMAHMIDGLIKRLETAMENESYIEATWLCYAFFEQRVNRMLSKVIKYCPCKESKRQDSAPISKRIECLKRLIRTKYWIFEGLNPSVLNEILDWNKDRNEMTHHLVYLKNYKQMDDEFKKIAFKGVQLVEKILKLSEAVRLRYYPSNEIPDQDFPVASKCKSKNGFREKCINIELVRDSFK